MAGMTGGLGKASHFVQKVFPAYQAGLFQGLTFYEFGNRRTTGHGRNAAFGPKTDIRNAVIFQAEREFEGVSAGGVFLARGAIRSLERAYISRVLKVIEQFGGVHREICKCVIL